MATLTYAVIGMAFTSLLAGFFTRDTTVPLYMSLAFSAAAALLVMGGWARRLKDVPIADFDEVIEKKGPKGSKGSGEAEDSPSTSDPEAPPADAPADDDEPSQVIEAVGSDDDTLVAEGREVAIVPGRERYHLSGCRFAEREDVRMVPEQQAVSFGYSPCSVCLRG